MRGLTSGAIAVALAVALAIANAPGATNLLKRHGMGEPRSEPNLASGRLGPEVFPTGADWIVLNFTLPGDGLPFNVVFDRDSARVKEGRPSSHCVLLGYGEAQVAYLMEGGKLQVLSSSTPVPDVETRHPVPSAWWINSIFRPPTTDERTSVNLFVGVSNILEWGSDMEFAIQLPPGADDVEVVAAGRLDCGSGFRASEGGAFVRTPMLSAATGERRSFTAQGAPFGYFLVYSDLGYALSISGPRGTATLEAPPGTADPVWVPLLWNDSTTWVVEVESYVGSLDHAFSYVHADVPAWLASLLGR